ncbi:MAG: type I secretion system permease/ATPase [Pseudomonadota bacterium]
MQTNCASEIRHPQNGREHFFSRAMRRLTWRRRRDETLPARAASKGAATPKTVDEILRPCRAVFVTLGLFSAIINILVLTGPLYMLQVYDRVLTSGQVETLLMLTAIAIGCLLFLGIFEALRSAMATRMGCWLAEWLGPLCLAAEVRRGLSENSRDARSLGDVSRIQGFLSSNNLSAFFDAPWAPIFVLLVWLLHPYLGMVALSSAIALFLLSLANEKVTRSIVQNSSQSQGAAMAVAQEMVQNSRELRSLGMERELTRRWRGHQLSSMFSARQVGERGGVIVAISKFVRMAVQIAILGTGAMLVLAGELTPGGMVAASILLGRALAPVEQAMSAWRAFVNVRLAHQRIKDLLRAYPDPGEKSALPAPRGELVVDRVSVAAPAGAQLLLNNISLHVSPGEALAIIGPSGAGKSTLCNLLVGGGGGRKAGEIRLDGARLESWDEDQLGGAIGYMSQKVHLFSGTIRENIARFRETSPEEVAEAAQLAGAHEMIMRLPRAYDTKIGPGGLNLSGGQAQRIGLARAIFGNPSFVVLDEPNSNLDNEGEMALVESLRKLKERGVTVVIVGHRASTIEEADKVLLLNRGVVADYGPRDHVLSRLQRGRPEASQAEAAPHGAQQQRQAQSVNETAASPPNPARSPQTEPVRHADKPSSPDPGQTRCADAGLAAQQTPQNLADPASMQTSKVSDFDVRPKPTAPSEPPVRPKPPELEPATKVALTACAAELKRLVDAKSNDGIRLTDGFANRLRAWGERSTRMLSTPDDDNTIDAEAVLVPIENPGDRAGDLSGRKNRPDEERGQ